MHIADYISNIGDFTEDTHLNFSKGSEQSGLNIIPLSCFSMQDGRWSRHDVPEGIDRMRMGRNPYECEFRIGHDEADDVHVIIQRAGCTWFVIESGKKDLMKVNGFPRRQACLRQNSTAVVQIGDMCFIFTTSMQQSRQNNDAATPEVVELQESQYGLSYNGKNINFDLEKICLIGSDPLCEFQIPGEPFCAMISNIGKRLFLNSLVPPETLVVRTERSPEGNAAPLKPGSVISIGNHDINFRLSKDLRFTQNFNFVPDPKSNCMRFLEIDSHGRAGNSYVLPPSGRSIWIGRDSSLCLLGICNSTKVSRVHAQSIIYDKSVLIIDNNTTNGTFVNGKRIKKRLLHPGDILRLGNLDFILCFTG
ncbi:MAG: FHA domain-containing protein [Victivallales bacterium]|nr:FHA domain-containing protein [Victivallales bacterium]